MSYEHELKYIDYIRKIGREIKQVHKLDVRYFLIISSSFRGDFISKSRKIHSETGVKLVLIQTKHFSKFMKKVIQLEIPTSILPLFDWQNLFEEDILLGEDHYDKYLKDFVQSYRNRF